MFFVTPAVMVKSELRGDLWQRCHLIGACVGARRATSPMKVTVEVGAASSSACLGVDCLAQAHLGSVVVCGEGLDGGCLK
jgi:hypothetical protein